MDRDDPAAPEFASWDRYNWFARRVLHDRRFVWDEDIMAFLKTVLASIRDRETLLPEGSIFYRAQLGNDWAVLDNDVGEEPVGYDAVRMRPRVYRAIDGRANPAGMPVLYLGTTTKTAISEIRPWLGASASLAQFRLLRPLKAIDLSRDHGQSSFGTVAFSHLMAGTEPAAQEKERAVWIDLDAAFSRPVTKSDDAADYVPTQILAELFRDAGYDAIIYKSQFDAAGFNLAIFNVEDACPINSMPCEITAIEVNFKEMGRLRTFYATANT